MQMNQTVFQEDDFIFFEFPTFAQSTTTTMSSTSTTTTAAQSSPPEIKILHRVASIPMISSSLVTINDALSSNAYTRSPYCTAKGLSTSAYKYTEPLQIKLAPLIERADGYVIKA